MTTQLVLHATDQSFQQEVLDRSREMPVVVDFWAPWCEPCRTLGPTLEAVAQSFGGRVQLVKVNTDESPAVSQQLGIQSIPAVMAVVDGQIVNQFVGVQPEPEVRRFFESLLPSRADELAAEAELAMRSSDVERATAYFEAALKEDPNHRAATLGLALLALDRGDLDVAEEYASRWQGEPRARQLLALIHFRRIAQGESREDLERRVEANEDDAEAHYHLGSLLAAAKEWEPALEHLLTAVRLDRTLDDDGARRHLLEVCDLLGEQHPLTQEYRRRLTNLLF